MQQEMTKKIDRCLLFALWTGRKTMVQCKLQINRFYLVSRHQEVIILSLPLLFPMCLFYILTTKNDYPKFQTTQESPMMKRESSETKKELCAHFNCYHFH